MGEEKAIYARIYGVVQGVGYRWFTKRVADELGIKGYVRNMDDGSVEVLAIGDEEKLAAFFEKLKEGPALSRVERIERREVEAKEPFQSFEIRR